VGPFDRTQDKLTTQHILNSVTQPGHTTIVPYVFIQLVTTIQTKKIILTDEIGSAPNAMINSYKRTDERYHYNDMLSFKCNIALVRAVVHQFLRILRYILVSSQARTCIMRFLWLFLTAFFFINLSMSQVAQVEFGKNRIQHHRDFNQWLSYESQNFVTYWYGKSRNVGQKSAQIAESVYEELVKTLEFRINDKIELIVYVDITDMKQSNIGSEEIVSGTSGQTKIERNKVFVYFDGNHRNLEVQIRQGVGSVLLNYMLFGTELQEIVQNMVALGLPPWFLQGLIAYMGEPWSIAADEQLRDALSTRNYRDFEHFARDNPAIAGRAFWFYFSRYHGKGEISNLIYLVRLNKNVENGVRSILGIGYQELLNNVWSFCRQLSEREATLMAESDVRKTMPFTLKKGSRITRVRAHPSEPLVALSSNHLGKEQVWLLDVQTGKRKRVLKKGYRNNIQETDYNYPLMAWSPSGRQLASIYEYRDKIYLEIYDLSTRKKEKQLLPNRYQRIYSLDFWDEQNLLFSASEQNFTDLYLYRMRTRQSRQLTTDIFDDADAVRGEYQGVKGIYFASNRDSESIAPFAGDSMVPLMPYNLYFLNPEARDSAIVRLTEQSNAHHRHPVYVPSKGLYFLDETTGMIHRRLMTFSGSSGRDVEALTDYPRNIQSFDVARSGALVVDVLHRYGRPLLLMSETRLEKPLDPHVTWYQERIRALGDRGLTGSESMNAPAVRQTQKPELKETNPDYRFQTYYDDPPEKTEVSTPFQILPRTAENARRGAITYEKINPLRIVPYRYKFRIDYVNTTFDNNPLFGGLESYSGTGELLFNNPMGLLFKANFKDLFEDYQVEGGIRLPTTFNGAEYFLLFDNKKRRLDRRFALYRRANYRTEGAIANLILIRSKKEILLGMYEVRYPLDVYTSLRGAVTVRQDRFSYLASEGNTLNEPPVVDQRVGARLEYVFDNTLKKELNLLNGTRYKLSVEMIKRFQIQLLDQVRFDLGQGFMTVLGLDARHYEPLGEHIVWATRLAGNTSFGTEKVLYLLGGSDNTLLPRFNDNIPLPSDASFAFQTLAPNVRGFQFNIRNGNSFALLNTEIRVPVFQMLSKRPIRSNFVRNFQIVPFFDAGTAWQGFSPFNKDNPLNTLFIGDINDPATPIAVKVNYFRDPIVAGYGIGLRTVLFGYFFRVDYAWGIETRMVQSPRFHFSMGLDF
jgi:hypothetical protein